MGSGEDIPLLRALAECDQESGGFRVQTHHPGWIPGQLRKPHLGDVGVWLAPLFGRMGWKGRPWGIRSLLPPAGVLKGYSNSRRNANTRVVSWTLPLCSANPSGKGLA